MQNQDVDEPYVKILEDIYSGSKATIVLHKESNRIPTKEGVRQEDIFSLMLFIPCQQEVLKALNWEQFGIRVSGEYLGNLRFADDTASGDELQRMITDLDTQSRTMRLKINMQKLKVMFNSLGREQTFPVGGEA